jgi:5-methylthioadenosine/S-adenosylhomocysteine deaminase
MSYFTSDYIYKEGQLLTEHYFYVRDGIIQEVAPLRQLNPRAFRDMIAFEEALIVPGLINGHTSSIQSLNPACLLDRELGDLPPQRLNPMSAEAYYQGALLTYSRLLKQGVTTVCDHVSITAAQSDVVEALVQAAEEIGIRLVLARQMTDQTPAAALHDASWLQPVVSEPAKEALEHVKQLMSLYKKHELVRVLPAPLGLQFASEALLLGVGELAVSQNSVFHLPLAHSSQERDWALNTHQLTPVAYLEKLGLLSPRCVCLHGLWLDDSDIALLAKTGTGLIETPTYSALSGAPPLRLAALLQQGVGVSLATGGAWRNARPSLLDEVRLASLLQKSQQGTAASSGLSAESLLAASTQQGGRHLNLPVGELSPGFKADFFVLDLSDTSLQPYTPQTLMTQVVYGMMPTALSASYVAGERVLDTGELLNYSEQQLQELLAKL